MKTRVLFVCTHNSARSQMAEALLKKYGNGWFEVFSAGLQPGVLNPFAVKVMRELEIDISKNITKDVFEFQEQCLEFDYVIAVCDPASARSCPIYPKRQEMLNWWFEDPSIFEGTEESKTQKFRLIRDLIKDRIINFIHDVRHSKQVKAAIQNQEITKAL